MPLSTPVERTLAHTRTITCHGYERADGCWDIEANMVDTKTFAFANQDRGGVIQAGEALHDMKIRLTVDNELRIQAIEATTDFAPFRICPNIAASYQQLVGKVIGPGWSRFLKERFSGIRGCTHLTELFGPLATTAFQTVYGSRFLRSESVQTEQPPVVSPRYFNTCHAWSKSSDMVRERWPEQYEAPTASDSDS